MSVFLFWLRVRTVPNMRGDPEGPVRTKDLWARTHRIESDSSFWYNLDITIYFTHSLSESLCSEHTPLQFFVTKRFFFSCWEMSNQFLNPKFWWRSCQTCANSTWDRLVFEKQVQLSNQFPGVQKLPNGLNAFGNILVTCVFDNLKLVLISNWVKVVTFN